MGEFSKTSFYEFVAAQFLIFFWPFDSETKMVWAVGRGAAALAALSAVATLAVIATSHSGRWVSLATAAVRPRRAAAARPAACLASAH